MDTSWESGESWYDQLVDDAGHYYHRELLLPEMQRIIERYKPRSILDLGCGQGVLERTLPPSVEYYGVDLSASLLKHAQDRASHAKRCNWIQADCCTDLPESLGKHPMIVVMLALQGMENPLGVFQNISKHLSEGGVAIIILNHPAFRIPRQSDWHYDERSGTLSRTVARYMSPLKIPVRLKPGMKEKSPVTWSYHLPLSQWFEIASETKLACIALHEWCSPKASTGKRAAAENRARSEIPMFCCLELIHRG